MQKEILDIILLSLSKETSFSPLKDDLSLNNQILRQSAIISLVVNDFFGGKIMNCKVNGINHYYNLINKNVIDLSATQGEEITENYKIGVEITRDYLLSNQDMKNCYKNLLINVKNNFIKYGTTNYKLIDENKKELISKVPGTLGGNKKIKIYGKFDCPNALKWIEKGHYVDNRVFFADEETAIKAGYRPCAICMKKEYKIWKQTH